LIDRFLRGSQARGSRGVKRALEVERRERDLERCCQHVGVRAQLLDGGDAVGVDLAFGLSATVLRAVEDAMLGTKVNLARAGDPAVAGIAARILKALNYGSTELEADRATLERLFSQTPR
jgi:hypothetical protein